MPGKKSLTTESDILQANDSLKSDGLAAIIQLSAHIAEGLFITDPEADILYISPRLEQMLGYSIKEIKDRGVISLWGEKKHPEIKKFLAGSSTDEKTWKGRIESPRKNGQTAVCEAVIFPVGNNDIPCRLFAGILIDISETALVSQLRQAQKMESLGHLASGLAHDFNNILTSIVGYASMILEMEENLSPLVKKGMTIIQNAAQQATDITRHLLTFGRKHPLDLKPVNLNDIVIQSMRFLKRTIGTNIRIEWNLDPRLKNIMGDGSLLEQVLINMCLNSRDAIAKDGIITVETANVKQLRKFNRRQTDPRKGPIVMLTIRDNGKGMDHETIKHIFDPFFTTKKSGKGTGLGLSIVYGIINSHGGAIEVESKPGAGAEFRMYFPNVTREKPRKYKTELTVKGGNETLLVVDDDVLVLELARDVLKDFGYNVLIARSGRQCLRTVKKHEGKVDLVISDIIMPEMSGLELVSLLHRTYPGISLILSSGLQNALDSNNDISSYIGAFVVKPYQARVLAYSVREVLDRPRQ